MIFDINKVATTNEIILAEMLFNKIKTGLKWFFGALFIFICWQFLFSNSNDKDVGLLFVVFLIAYFIFAPVFYFGILQSARMKIFGNCIENVTQSLLDYSKEIDVNLCKELLDDSREYPEVKEYLHKVTNIAARQVRVGDYWICEQLVDRVNQERNEEKQFQEFNKSCFDLHGL